MTQRQAVKPFTVRRWLLISVFLVTSIGLLWRAVELHVMSNDFLRHHGDARALRVISIPAHRGMISDRNGEPLAISTPVDSVWVTPKAILEAPERLLDLAARVEEDPAALRRLLEERSGREFVYVKRHVTPDAAEAIRRLAIPGVHLQREYKRYYPAGEITAHLIGFTNVDDVGQEAIELAFDHWLRGQPGSKRVLKDRLGRIVQDVESIMPPDPGRELRLSIDRRVQYLAYRELKLAVAEHRARSGSLVLMDPWTGEVLAMAAQPSYNPNNRSGLKSERYRNRAVTDVFEPGSTLKPFTIAAALSSGQFTPRTVVETRPGYVRVSDHMIRDLHDYGTLDVSGVIRKSSNVGASKIALSIGPRPLWEVCEALGFGRETGSGFPGEAAGVLQNYQNWSEIELATAAFGHGISVTTLQLAHAYSAIATDGVLHPVSLQRVEGALEGQQVLQPEVAMELRRMLESAVGPDGTGHRAAVRGYRVAGKTGTAHKSELGGYSEDRYTSSFAGMAPASAPRLVLVVVIDEPQAGGYFGGQVAAPVFARVMQGALRILNIPPDDVPGLERGVMVADGSVDGL